MRSRRQAAAVAGLVAVGLTVPLALLAATPAAAATLQATPNPVVEHGRVALAGQVDEALAKGQLRLVVPGGEVRVLATGADRVVGHSFQTAPCDAATSTACGGQNVVRNGRYSVELWEVQRAFGRGDRPVATVPLLVDVPAGTPRDVAASIDGRSVTVTWARGVGEDGSLVEPDVRWVVDDGQGLTRAVDPDACAGGTCSAVVDYPADASGARSFTVVASRPCDGCQAPPTRSQPAAEVVVPPAPTPSASPGSPGEPSPGASPGATPDGAAPGDADAVAGGAAGGGSGRTSAARSFAQGFSSFAPKLGLPKLPPLPNSAQAPVATPQVADGTFEDSLGYQDRVVQEPVAGDRGSGRSALLTSTGDLLDDEQLARSLAGALLLLLVGAHLRTWVARGRREADRL